MASVGYLPQSNSVNRAVLEENRSIKTVSETFLRHFIRNVNYLTWPDPMPFMPFLKVQSDTWRKRLRCASDIHNSSIVIPRVTHFDTFSLNPLFHCSLRAVGSTSRRPAFHYSNCNQASNLWTANSPIVAIVSRKTWSPAPWGRN